MNFIFVISLLFLEILNTSGNDSKTKNDYKRPEIRSMIDAIKSGDVRKLIDIDKLLKKFFGQAEVITTCDPYYIYRARFAEVIQELMQGSKGSYKILDPSSKYYGKMLHDKLLHPLPRIPSEVVFSDDNLANHDWVTHERTEEFCKTKTREVPMLKKFIEFIMSANFIPKKMKDMYAAADDIRKTKIGTEVFRLIGRRIQLDASLKKIKSGTLDLDEYYSILDSVMVPLRNITQRKYERDFVGELLDGVFKKQEAAKGSKVDVVYEPNFMYKKDVLPMFGPEVRSKIVYGG